MRRQFVECKTRATAERRTPWAAVWIKVEGGWRAFESTTDAEVWRLQR